jgi:hypothetical protein
MLPTLPLPSTRLSLLRSLTLLPVTAPRASARALLLGLPGVGKLLVIDQSYSCGGCGCDETIAIMFYEGLCLLSMIS